MNRSDNGGGVSTFSATCVSINMMIGAGMLALPYGFVQGGIISSIIILIAICFWMIITCLWEGRSVIQCGRVLNAGSKVPEVTEAFYVFCGSRWRDTYATVLNISLLSCSWVLAILFAQTLSSSLPWIYHPEEICLATSNTSNCNTRYLINMIILALITTPLALMDAKEQWYIQNSLTAIRVVRVILMCATPLMAVTTQDMFQSFPGSFTNIETPIIVSPPFWIGTVFGLSQILSSAVFSQFMNGSIPIVVDCLADRNNFKRTLYYTFFICLGLYLFLALIIAFKFGDRTMNPCNLNWAGYRWPADYFPPESCSKHTFCDLSAKFVEFLVVFCPALDVASAYPFLGIILGNTLTEIILGPPPVESHHATTGTENHHQLQLHHQTTTSMSRSPNGASPSLSSISRYRFFNKLLRFIMNILPMILAVTLTDFSRVIQLTGSVSVLLCTVFPPLLSMKCNNYLEETDPCFIQCDESMEWVDPIMASSGVKTGPSLNTTGIRMTIHTNKQVQYGSINQNDAIDSTSSSPDLMEKDWISLGFMVRPKEDLIETRSFQMVMLIVGVVLAVLIFYISF